jgi:hypothetical protein
MAKINDNYLKLKKAEEELVKKAEEDLGGGGRVPLGQERLDEAVDNDQRFRIGLDGLAYRPARTGDGVTAVVAERDLPLLEDGGAFARQLARVGRITPGVVEVAQIRGGQQPRVRHDRPRCLWGRTRRRHARLLGLPGATTRRHGHGCRHDPRTNMRHEGHSGPGPTPPTNSVWAWRAPRP